MTATDTAEGRPEKSSRPEILVAEDDFEMRRLVCDCLRKGGYEVREVADGSALLRMVEGSLLIRNALDLVLTDVRMPGFSGLEIVAFMRDAGVHVPVVVMTAFGNLATQARAAELGATLLEKPFKMEELRSLVGRLLSE